MSLRMHNDVLEAYRATGRGWQTRMNEVLRAAIPNLAHTESERLDRIVLELSHMADRLREDPRNTTPVPANTKRKAK